MLVYLSDQSQLSWENWGSLLSPCSPHFWVIYKFPPTFTLLASVFLLLFPHELPVSVSVSEGWGPVKSNLWSCFPPILNLPTGLNYQNHMPLWVRLWFGSPDRLFHGLRLPRGAFQIERAECSLQSKVIVITLVGPAVNSFDAICFLRFTMLPT